MDPASQTDAAAAAPTAHADLFASCDHRFTLLKSDTSLLQWHCQQCHVGPSWFVFVCGCCGLRVCRGCASKS